MSVAFFWVVFTALQDPAPPPKESQRPLVLPRISVWFPAVSGFSRADEAGLEGSEAWHDDDLGVGEFDAVLQYELAIFSDAPTRDGAVGVSLFYLGHRWKGGAILDTDEAFEGSVFPAGARVTSTLQFDDFGLEAKACWAEPADHLRAEGTLGLHYLAAEVDIKTSLTGESELFADLLLRLGARGDWTPPGGFGAGGAFHFWLGLVSLLDEEDDDESASDGQVSIGVDMAIYGFAEFAPLRIEAGFRVFAWEYSRGDEEFELALAGPFLGVRMSF